eukprot:1327856-Ditylum_brightwellii.AAC.1
METSSMVNPHKTFTSDLLHWMKSAKSRGELFILGGDLNETLHNTSDMIKLGYDHDLQLVDVQGDLTNSQFSTTKT